MKYFNSTDARALINDFDFAIFPIHGVKENGGCTCNNAHCSNVGKHPATPDGFKSASKDIEQVKRLWAGRKGLNVGIATGKASGVFVVDIDSPEAEQEFYKRFSVPDTYTVKTGRGKHLYFLYEDDKPVKNGAHIIPGVDVRGDGGYVAGAGSIHASGVTYQALNPLEVINQCPQEIYDFINKPKELYTQSQKLYATSDGWTLEQIREHLSYIDPDLPHDDWVKIGMALHEEGAPFYVWDEWSAKGAKYQNGLCQAKWKSFHKGGGVSYGTVVKMAQNAGWHTSRHSSLPSPDIIKQEAQEIEKLEGFNILDWIASEKYAGKAPELEWIIEDILQKNIPALLAAMGGLGKSFTILDLCIEIAKPPALSPKRVLGGNIVEHGKCVFFTAEDSKNSVHRRIEAICSHETLQTTKENLIVVPMPDAGGAQSLIKEGRDGVITTDFYDVIKSQLMQIEDIKLIVFDPLQAFVGADITSKPENAQYMWTALAHLASICDASILCTHHMRKDGLKAIKTLADAREAIRGTTGIIDGCRMVYSMWQADTDTGKKIASDNKIDYAPENFVLGGVVKSNDTESRDITIFIRQDNGVLKDSGNFIIDHTDKGMTIEQCKQTLREMDMAWQEGKPFGRAHNSSRPVINWMVKTFNISRNAAKTQLDNWLNPSGHDVPILEERQYQGENKRPKTGLYVNRVY